ncbi:hypothetical protein MGN70_004216 [Eutypa lata]|nr:hypothetical protein MGN70_004216 [Eutypa lata]
MKFLCLHGMGTNASVYEAQLAPIRAQMDPADEFIFVEGLTECRPAEGVSNFFSGPFYCYYNKPTVECLQAAYDLIQEIVEEEGPFHGVFGFSQGGALAASLLLHHQKVAPYSPSLFNFAVFTCASLPFDLNTKHQEHPYDTVIHPKSGVVSVSDWRPGESRVEPEEINGFIVPPEPGDIMLRRYHPARETTRIQIPTVHIMGQADPFLPQQQALAELCDDKGILEHELGHQLPRGGAFPQKSTALVQEAITKAMFKC